MQFLILARDHTDNEALSRRMGAREDHIALSDEAISRGEQLFGVAMLDEQGQMCGSAMIVNFPSKEDVENWLKKEPYMTKEVWDKVEIIPCKVGPSFEAISE